MNIIVITCEEGLV